MQCPNVAESREFLMVSGDMYCSSSFAGNTRRYHGLLISKGTLLLSGLHDEVNGIRLSGGWWGDTFLPGGLPWIINTIVYPVRQLFSIPGARIIRSIFFDGGLVIRYEVNGTASLLIRPLMTKRPVRELSRDPELHISEEKEELVINGCTFSTPLKFTEDIQWYLNAFYPRESERGYDAWEDLASPGFFSGIVTNGVVDIRVTPHGILLFPDDISDSNSDDILIHASRLCISGKEIRAGYHHYTESRGRDTFISLPGLLLETGKFREAEEIFRWHLAHRKGGILVNRYPDSSLSVDTTLWYFWALFQYVQKLPGSPFIATIRNDIEEILHLFIKSDVVSLSGNLVSVQKMSTWMDTQYTPRNGKPVEINALWILALELAEYLKISSPVSSQDARREFALFWNETTGCFYDCLDPNDSSVRSNQVIPLAFGLVPFDEGRKALSVIKEKLLTPYGLRTLSPDSADYHGYYNGDISYHNGMVWPWQTGFYIDALFHYGENQEEILKVVQPLWTYFLCDGVGMLPELFDGDAPHKPAGAICQSFSIGEMMRSKNLILNRICKY
jgi:glycogen debranching enzyme